MRKSLVPYLVVGFAIGWVTGCSPPVRETPGPSTRASKPTTSVPMTVREPIELGTPLQTAEQTRVPATATRPATQATIPSPTPAAKAKVNANLRGGPGTGYEIVGAASAGQVLKIIGRNAAGDWLNLASGAWILAELVDNPPVVPEVTAAPAVAKVTATAGAATVEVSDRVEAQVVDVVDGDTIKVSIDGQVYSLRYIGVDAPEVSQPFGSQATAKNRELVGGKRVTLERDVSQTDKYGRLLRYVWLGEMMVNAELVRTGYASAATFPPDVKHQSLFATLQREASSSGRGLWAAPTPKPTMAAVAPSGRGNCDASYPDVCIPPPPPDLDCKDVPFRRFRVLPPDPHRFDGDHDGIGCES